MKINLYTIVIFVFSCICLTVYSQEETSVFPSDLEAETVLFFKYDSLPIESHMHPKKQAKYKKENEKRDRANKVLEEKAKLYPYNYKMDYRSNIKNLSVDEYKFIIDSQLMIENNNGASLRAGVNSEFYAPVYVLNRETNLFFELFRQETNELYDFNDFMDDVIKMINREYEK